MKWFNVNEMKKSLFAVLMIVGSVSFSLGAIVSVSGCGSVTSNDVHTGSFVVYTTDEIAADKANLDGTEKALEKVGMKFVKRVKPGVGSKPSGTEIAWDEEVLEGYEGKIKDALPFLQNFVTVTSDYLQKYNRNFRIKGESEKKYHYMKSSERTELLAKIRLAQKSITEMEKEDQPANPEAPAAE
jgi:hypothetical protein